MSNIVTITVNRLDFGSSDWRYDFGNLFVTDHEDKIVIALGDEGSQLDIKDLSSPRVEIENDTDVSNAELLEAIAELAQKDSFENFVRPLFFYPDDSFMISLEETVDRVGTDPKIVALGLLYDVVYGLQLSAEEVEKSLKNHNSSEAYEPISSLNLMHTDNKLIAHLKDVYSVALNKPIIEAFNDDETIEKVLKLNKAAYIISEVTPFPKNFDTKEKVVDADLGELSGFPKFNELNKNCTLFTEYVIEHFDEITMGQVYAAARLLGDAVYGSVCTHVDVSDDSVFYTSNLGSYKDASAIKKRLTSNYANGDSLLRLLMSTNMATRSFVQVLVRLAEDGKTDVLDRLNSTLESLKGSTTNFPPTRHEGNSVATKANLVWNAAIEVALERMSDAELVGRMIGFISQEDVTIDGIYGVLEEPKYDNMSAHDALSFRGA